ncbi:TetR family transcriptional regulator [Nocardioides sp. Soil774]|uniref:TetR/AcrR family transcriptional regulator n=1 Tax=Nocardioides sp. Soil774 TaxID=1736408 RepID=UPI0007002A48|nr:TetR/AcrR family transcriptional regulator [Nocardioides sp. Soil774]KRE94035.1 TetR family transcriptional regulator [Nocardioides sp. Soil774]
MEHERRRHIARTALHVLATAGGRGLTHRAVDTAAGVPAGSTSYYFRTRAALLNACLDDLVEQDLAELDLMQPLVTAADAEVAAGALADLVLHWLTAGRERHLARYELCLESLRRPEVAEVLQAGGRSIRHRVADLLTELGAPDARQRADWLVACLDGIVHDRLVGANRDTRPSRDELVAMTRRLTGLALAP